MLEVQAKESGLTMAKRYAAGSARAARDMIIDDPRLGLAILILSAMVLLTVFAPLVAPYDPEMPDSAARLAPPSSEHFFGADVNGMDVFSRILYAPRVDLMIATVSVAFSVVAGCVLGLIAGYFTGRRTIAGVAAELLNRFMDIIQAFPVFIVALALVGVAGRSTQNLIIILAILFSPVFFRFVRGEAIAVRERLFVEAETALGNPVWRLMFRHVLPNSMSSALVQISVNMGFAILLTAGLSFVGAGVRPPTPEWGIMISVGSKQMITGQWWVSFFPGVAVALTVFSFAIIGESVRVRLERW
jgi:peptide/nickel transport system permease protein